MLDKIKTHLQRIEVRFAELGAVVLLALPEILDALGAVDLNAVLKPFLGDDAAAKYTPVLMLAIALMRPIVHLHPHSDEETH